MSIQAMNPGIAPQISLANEGQLSLTFIGSGSAFSKKYFQNNVLIVKGSSHLLVDCGTRTPEALARLGLSVTQVQNYLITHSHADHIGGLEEVMLVNRYGPRKKPNIYITEDYQKILWEYSLRGGASYNENRDGKTLDFEDFWNVTRPLKVQGADRELATTECGAISIAIFRTKHIPDSAPTWKESFTSYGVIIDGRILYTSDTRFDPEMLEYLDARFNFECIFHDCQLFTGGVHASLDELATLPQSLKKRIHLMHYQDSAETQADRAVELGFTGFVEQWKTYDF
jgi:ribonuclease BN (tRNA processing enzyme)